VDEDDFIFEPEQLSTSTVIHQYRISGSFFLAVYVSDLLRRSAAARRRRCFFFRQFQCISINHGSTIEEQSGHRRRRRWREKLRAAGDRTVQLSPRGAMNAADACTARALFCCNPAALGGTGRISRAEPGRARLLTSRPSRWLVSHCQTEHKSQDKVGDDAPADWPPYCHATAGSRKTVCRERPLSRLSQTRRRFSWCGYLGLVAGAFCLVCIC